MALLYESEDQSSVTDYLEYIVELPEFPAKLSLERIDRYLCARKKVGDNDFTENSPEIKKILMASHYLFFHLNIEFPLEIPNFQSLEDIGPMQMEFGNRGGGKWIGLYRGLDAGRSSTASKLWLGVNFGKNFELNTLDGLYILVGIESDEGLNHRLQLQLNKKNCRYDKSKNCWEITHDGRMTIGLKGKGNGISNHEVIDAVKRSNASHLIIPAEKNKERVRLGLLFPPKDCTWQKSEELIINLIQYTLIRNNLRKVKLFKHEQSKRKST